jgi:hypothetical protein
MQVAAAVCQDRLQFSLPDDQLGFGGLFGFNALLVSAVMTQSIEDRWVQLDCTALPPINAQIQKFGPTTSGDNLDFSGVMNIRDDLIGLYQGGAPGGGVELNLLSGTNVLNQGDGPLMDQYSGDPKNDRGTWLGAMLIQGLGVSCTLPQLPPDNEPAVELTYEESGEFQPG